MGQRAIASQRRRRDRSAAHLQRPVAAQAGGAGQAVRRCHRRAGDPRQHIQQRRATIAGAGPAAIHQQGGARFERLADARQVIGPRRRLHRIQRQRAQRQRAGRGVREQVHGGDAMPSRQRRRHLPQAIALGIEQLHFQPGREPGQQRGQVVERTIDKHDFVARMGAGGDCEFWRTIHDGFILFRWAGRRRRDARRAPGWGRERAHGGDPARARRRLSCAAVR